MEHSCEAYWTKAEGLARDAICTMGLGAKRLTDAAKRQLEIADLRAGVNVGLRELGELLYATHTGTCLLYTSNPRPVFALLGATVDSVQAVGQGKHLKLRLSNCLLYTSRCV